MSVVNCVKCHSPEVFGCTDKRCPERTDVPIVQMNVDDRLRALQQWLRTEARGYGYDPEAVADLIDEWITR